MSIKTPYNPSISLVKIKGPNISEAEYAKIIRSIMFLMNYARPDIACDVTTLSCYNHNPNYEYWNALHRFLKYLKGTMNWCLHFSKFPAVLERFCDIS